MTHLFDLNSARGSRQRCKLPKRGALALSMFVKGERQHSINITAPKLARQKVGYAMLRV